MENPDSHYCPYGYPDEKSRKPLEYSTFGNIDYLALNNFNYEIVVTQFYSLFVEISKTKGLIIDIRYNGSGIGNISFYKDPDFTI